MYRKPFSGDLGDNALCVDSTSEDLHGRRGKDKAWELACGLWLQTPGLDCFCTGTNIFGENSPVYKWGIMSESKEKECNLPKVSVLMFTFIQF